MRVQLARDLIMLTKAVLHHEEYIVSQQPLADVRCPAEKPHHLSVEEIAIARVTNLCNVSALFTLPCTNSKCDRDL